MTEKKVDHLEEAKSALQSAWDCLYDYNAMEISFTNIATTHALIALVERLDKLTDDNALAVHAMTWDANP